jgi:hypothetical protein
MFYRSNGERLRAFFGDKRNFKANDIGEGWLLFEHTRLITDCPLAENETGVPACTLSISFFGDNIEAVDWQNQFNKPALRENSTDDYIIN